jgi:hypothetical protein
VDLNLGHPLHIGGGGEYCGGNEPQLGRITVLYHEAPSGKDVSRAVLFDLEHGLIGAARASPLGELFSPGNSVNQNAGAGNNRTMAHYKKAGHEFC